MGNSWSIVLVSSLAFLGGCVQRPGGHYVVAIDTGFTVDQQQAIVDAAEAWKQAVPQLQMDVVFTPCSGDADTHLCIHAADTATVLAEGGHYALGGTTHCQVGLFSSSSITAGAFSGIDGGETWIDVAAPIADFERIAGHEMGHGMGLSHQDEVYASGHGALMYPFYSLSDSEPDCHDANQWLQLRGMPLVKCSD